ncbi:hypothetical protein O9G_004857 [Rozella allomycis CSF55]|uniref:Uncharacterized protein n=1 Tax=Rozella allomycis (strain CSF55) TaxID=988480 RepID=A0A075B513_ROZAC|nr:hypothetical protein O9G_004857 [Rozella allomycis CSF55]|eukprot:EPZ36638.1 hypothetical protein O9G_004857 [Rozella allomycis CSF55]
MTDPNSLENILELIETQRITEIPIHHVQVLIKEALEQISSKENDIITATNIAEILLKEKTEIEAAYESLREESRNNKTVQMLEEANGKLIKEVEELKATMLEKDKEIRRLENRIESLESLSINDKENYNQIIENLQVELQNQKNLKEDYDKLNQDHEKQLNNLIEKIERKNETLEYELGEAKEKLAETSSLSLELEEYKVLFEQTTEELQLIKDDFVNQSQELEQCKSLINEYRLTIDSLTKRLDPAQQPEAPCDENPLNHSLFSEIEDKRVELENKHDSLLKKHSGLIRRHKETVQKQEQMTSHISRLTQLTFSNSSDDQIQRLSQIISQLRSENETLQKMLDSNAKGPLNKIQQNLIIENEDLPHILKLTNDQLSIENESLKKEIKSLTLINNERLMTSENMEKEVLNLKKELSEWKMKTIQLNYELEQIQASNKLDEQVHDDEEGNNGNEGESVRENFDPGQQWAQLQRLWRDETAHQLDSAKKHQEQLANLENKSESLKEEEKENTNVENNKRKLETVDSGTVKPPPRKKINATINYH